MLALGADETSGVGGAWRGVVEKQYRIQKGNAFMARNNHCSLKGDLAGDIYFDVFQLNGENVSYVRFYMFIKGTAGASTVKFLRVCAYGPLADLAYGYLKKGSRVHVLGHVQTRQTRKGQFVFEVVAEEIDFLRNIDWERGENVRRDLVARGVLRRSRGGEDIDGASVKDAPDGARGAALEVDPGLLPDDPMDGRSPA